MALSYCAAVALPGKYQCTFFHFSMSGALLQVASTSSHSLLSCSCHNLRCPHPHPNPGITATQCFASFRSRSRDSHFGSLTLVPCLTAPAIGIQYIRNMTNQNTDSQVGKSRRYSVTRLLELAPQTIAFNFDLSKFTYDAARGQCNKNLRRQNESEVRLTRTKLG